MGYQIVRDIVAREKSGVKQCKLSFIYRIPYTTVGEDFQSSLNLSITECFDFSKTDAHHVDLGAQLSLHLGRIKNPPLQR